MLKQVEDGISKGIYDKDIVTKYTEEEIEKLNDTEIGNRIRELTKKRNSAKRFSRNPDLLNQLQIALNTLFPKNIKN